MKLISYGTWKGKILIEGDAKPIVFPSDGTRNITTEFGRKKGPLHIVVDVQRAEDDFLIKIYNPTKALRTNNENGNSLKSMHLGLIAGYIKYCQRFAAIAEVNEQNMKLLSDAVRFTSQEVSKP